MPSTAWPLAFHTRVVSLRVTMLLEYSRLLVKREGSTPSSDAARTRHWFALHRLQHCLHGTFIQISIMNQNSSMFCLSPVQLQDGIGKSRGLSKHRQRLAYDALAVASGVRPVAMLDYARTTPRDLMAALAALNGLAAFQGEAPAPGSGYRSLRLKGSRLWSQRTTPRV